jgi:hypothetical protein
MWTTRKRLVVWALFIVVAAPSIFFGVRYVFSSDPGIAVASDFLRRSGDLVSVVGDVREVQVVQKLAVGRTAAEPAYTIYTFVVTGARGERTVAVRVTATQNADGSLLEQHRLESIR